MNTRTQTRDALSPVALRSWRKQILSHARARVAQFDCEQPIDLIKDYAEPVCLELALLGHAARSSCDSASHCACGPGFAWRQQRILWMSR